MDYSGGKKRQNKIKLEKKHALLDFLSNVRQMRISVGEQLEGKEITGIPSTYSPAAVIEGFMLLNGIHWSNFNSVLH